MLHHFTFSHSAIETPASLLFPSCNFRPPNFAPITVISSALSCPPEVELPTCHRIIGRHKRRQDGILAGQIVLPHTFWTAPRNCKPCNMRRLYKPKISDVRYPNGIIGFVDDYGTMQHSVVFVDFLKNALIMK